MRDLPDAKPKMTTAVCLPIDPELRDMAGKGGQGW